MLGLLGGGGAALLGTLFTRDEAMAGHDGTNVLHLGEQNVAPVGASTSVEATADGKAAFEARNATEFRNESGVIRGVHSGPDFGIGVEGVIEGEAGSGVAGRGGFFGVSGQTDGGGAGVKGIGAALGGGDGETLGVGVLGVSFDSIGVHGQTESSVQPAVLGESLVCVERGPCEGESTGTGVIGRSDAGTGVRGDCRRGTGVEAVSGDGLALDVVGRARFSTAGSAVIPAGAESVFVANPAVTANSHIQVTLVSDPGARQVRWVERSPGSGFTVHLSSAPLPRRPETSLTYLIVEPG